jgi:hypothetical protein
VLLVLREAKRLDRKEAVAQRVTRLISSSRGSIVRRRSRRPRFARSEHDIPSVTLAVIPCRQADADGSRGLPLGVWL